MIWVIKELVAIYEIEIVFDAMFGSYLFIAALYFGLDVMLQEYCPVNTVKLHCLHETTH